MGRAAAPDVIPCPVCGAYDAPLLADLYSGAGGAGWGYRLAGFHNVGVDNRPQPRYPGCFILADALEVPLGRYAAVHASPPCQDYSKAIRHLSNGAPRLISATRARLLGSSSRLLWVIENVEGSGLPRQDDLWGAYGLELCGTMFDLSIWRHRLFELSLPVSPPRPCNHDRPPLNPLRDRAAGRTSERIWRIAAGLGWMQKREARQAIPPAYTLHIGRAFMAVLELGGAA